MEENVGIAVLLSVNPDTGETNADTFREGECEDPVGRAEGLRESCRKDFPERMWAIAANERARSIRGDALVEALFGDPEPGEGKG